MSTFGLSYHVRNNATSARSAWERFLHSSGLPESGCASLVVGGTRQGSAIRSWVRQNYASKYVPEHILEAIGLRKQLALRWQEEDCSLG
jgi:hypothetical protein